VRILGLDTSTRATSTALLDTDTGLELELRDDPPPGDRPRHAGTLLPMIAQLLEQSGAGWEAIDRLAVGRGPGTFTGLRIGIATARALAQARGLELLGVSTLRSLALNGAGDGRAHTVLAVLDARRGEAFAAAWPRGEIEGGAAVLEPAALPPESLEEGARRLPPPALALGDGAIEFRGVLERSGALVPESDARIHAVTAINHCKLAEAANALDPGDVLPEYLRVPDAELTRRTEHRNER
jgi:tRNA threonylcarbamoyladenosine biosynthesis protein TsaB